LAGKPGGARVAAFIDSHASYFALQPFDNFVYNIGVA
jgi:hypothetical protein